MEPIASDSNLGVLSGSETVGLSAEQNGPHNHKVYNFNATGPITPCPPLEFNSAWTGFAADLYTATSGGGTPHQNMQPSLYLNYLVKL